MKAQTSGAKLALPERHRSQQSKQSDDLAKTYKSENLASAQGTATLAEKTLNRKLKAKTKENDVITFKDPRRANVKTNQKQ